MDKLSHTSLSDLPVSKKRELLAELLQKKAERPRSLPLSFAQQGLWFLHQMAPENPVYNVCCTITMSGPLQKLVLEQSLSELLRRHQVLRTRFDLLEGHPVQLIDPAREVLLPVADLTLLSTHAREAEIQRLHQQEIRRPFDLARGPLLRVRLLRLGTEEHHLLLSLHHIVADGWSMGLLFQELGALYTAFSAGLPSPLPALSIQYADFILWQRDWLTGELLDQHLTYWKEQLADLPQLALPTDRPRPAVQTFAGAAEPFHLSSEITSRLKTLSQSEGVTLFMTLLAGFQIVLARYSGQEDIVVGTLIANRTRNELENLVGFLANTLALRTDLSGDPTVRNLLGRIREVALGAYAHQDISFERLVEELHPQRDPGQNPLFQVMLALQNAPYEPLELPGMKLHLSLAQSGTSKFDLSLFLWESAGGLSGSVEYSTDLFDASTLRRMLTHYRQILAGMTAHPEQRLSELPLLTQDEREQLRGWNATEREYPRDVCLHELFEQQVEQVPDAVALTFGDKQCTYSELNARANQLAHSLRHLGIEPDTCIGLFLERSIEMVIGLLGILKAGGAYVPLDPDYPAERLTFILRDAQIPVLITQQCLLERLPAQSVDVLCLDTGWQSLGERSAANLCLSIKTSNLAYIIYTSGSTGIPKGVAMPHEALVNLFTWQQGLSALSAGTRTLQFASLNFDVSAQEIFCTLGFGQSLVLLAEEFRRDPVALLNVLIEQAIERLFLPVIVLHQLAEVIVTGGSDSAPRLLREVITAGEQLQITPQVARMFEHLPATVLYNHYGPSECHAVSYYRLAGASANWPSLPPIGRPVANTELYLLDGHLQLVPVGVPGELYIGGSGLARGYLARPERTAERFVPHPFSSVAGARLYKTGDLVCYLPDGNLQFLGRRDHQVKLRGFRIELGEIEVMLSRRPDVQRAVVLVHEERSLDEQPDQQARAVPDKFLVAYLVAQAGPIPTTSELRVYLSQHLPEYMIPSVYMWLDALPYLPNGKLDRRALPEPEGARPTLEKAYIAPGTPLERYLAGVWQELLKLEMVGIHDNFFELGGDSIKAVLAINNVQKRFGIVIYVVALFNAPTIAQLANYLGEQYTEEVNWLFGRESLPSALSSSAPVHRSHESNSNQKDKASAKGLPPITPRPVDGKESFPLSYAQERLWFLSQWDAQRSVYHISSLQQLQGRLDVGALERSLNEMVRRHEVLRTTFPSIHGSPTQVIAPHLRIPLPVVDLCAVPTNEREAGLHHLSREETQRPFDLSRGPLLRALLLRVQPYEHLFSLLMHHSISDGWSMGIFNRELAALYEAFSQGRPSPLPDLPLQYADYAFWQREALHGPALQSQLAYWKQQLADLFPLELPTDHPRPAIQRFQGRTLRFHFSQELAAALRLLSQRTGVTLFMTLLAGFQILLSRYSRQTDIAVGTPIANRTRSEVEGLIGSFVNTLVLRLDLSGNPSVQDLLTQARQRTLEAYTNQDLPFDTLVEALNPQRSMSHHPLFQVLFAFQNVPATRLTLSNLQVHPVQVDTTTTHFDLTLALTEEADGLVGDLEYDSALFDEPTIEGMSTHYLRVLAALAAAPNARLSALSLLTEAEQEQLRTGSRTGSASYFEASVPTVFEEQAERTPEAVALVFEEQHLTYGELNARANQLAHYLRRAGVGEEGLVGLGLERSLEMVVGLLAILKAGGAYVPLDQSYPRERLAFLQQDAQISVLLTQAHLRDRFAGGPVVVRLDADWPDIAQQSRQNPVSVATAESLGYVVYTSGSTGYPKGVLVPQRGILRLVCEGDYVQLDAHHTLLQLAPISFDAATFELWGALLRGGRCVLYAGELVEVEGIGEVVRREHITMMWLTASLFNAVVDEFPEALSGVQHLLIGGEALSVSHVRRGLEALPDVRLINGYGPTENTTFSCCESIERPLPSTIRSIPIGRPIAHTQAYVLDQEGQAVPVGIAGELYLGGAGLARGYVGRAELTAERFVPHPFSSEPGERLYQTGDLVRYLPDGRLEFLGREDGQIKLRGFRIEPGEIEKVLTHHEEVQEAVVLAREDVPGDKRLVAYVVRRQTSAPPTSAQLRQYLLGQMPGYMIPTHFVLLDYLPQTPSGKVNRRALPAPLERDLEREKSYEAPHTPMEEQIADIWCEVLHLKQVGVHDDFFLSGGNSLLAIQVVSRIRETLAVEVPLRLLFETPTIAALVEYLEQVGQDMRQEIDEEEFHIPALSRGEDDVEQLLDLLEHLSVAEVQTLLVTDASRENRERKAME